MTHGEVAQPQPGLGPEDLRWAGQRALKSGMSGGLSMLVQVHALMWMHTTVNYQYRHGGQVRETLRRLYGEGGLRRFYKGYPFALVQGPLCRFLDTFTNTLVLTTCERHELTRQLPIAFKTALNSVIVASFRILLVPLDTLKTCMQVEGANGLRMLRGKVRASGVGVMYQGATAAFAATLASNFPWFCTYNLLNQHLPQPDSTAHKYLRQALIGFCCAAVADISSNSLRVIKTTRQTAPTVLPYGQAVRLVVEKDGLRGLFFRGLKVKLACNCVQSMFFTVLWRYFENKLTHKNAPQR